MLLWGGILGFSVGCQTLTRGFVVTAVFARSSWVVEISECLLRKGWIGWFGVGERVDDWLLAFDLNNLYHSSFDSLGVCWRPLLDSVGGVAGRCDEFLTIWVDVIVGVVHLKRGSCWKDTVVFGSEDRWSHWGFHFKCQERDVSRLALRLLPWRLRWVR